MIQSCKKEDVTAGDVDDTTINSSSAITLKVSGKGVKGFRTGGGFTLTNGTLKGPVTVNSKLNTATL